MSFIRMMKSVFALLMMMVTFGAGAQELEGDLVNWKDRNRLTWDDYKGKPDPHAGAAASTATYLAVEYTFKDGKLGYNITCSFSKSKSWGLHKNDHILAHEQGHFDIAEIFARRLYKKLKEYQFDKKNYQADLRGIYENITKEKEDMQNRYDNETNHSINKEKQQEWLGKIGKELKDTEAFSHY